jgi:hypothetical protein
MSFGLERGDFKDCNDLQLPDVLLDLIGEYTRVGPLVVSMWTNCQGHLMVSLSIRGWNRVLVPTFTGTDRLCVANQYDDAHNGRYFVRDDRGSLQSDTPAPYYECSVARDQRTLVLRKPLSVEATTISKHDFFHAMPNDRTLRITVKAGSMVECVITGDTQPDERVPLVRSTTLDYFPLFCLVDCRYLYYVERGFGAGICLQYCDLWGAPHHQQQAQDLPKDQEPEPPWHKAAARAGSCSRQFILAGLPHGLIVMADHVLHFYNRVADAWQPMLWDLPFLHACFDTFLGCFYRDPYVFLCTRYVSHYALYQAIICREEWTELPYPA